MRVQFLLPFAFLATACATTSTSQFEVSAPTLLEFSRADIKKAKCEKATCKVSFGPKKVPVYSEGKESGELSMSGATWEVTKAQRAGLLRLMDASKAKGGQSISHAEKGRSIECTSDRCRLGASMNGEGKVTERYTASDALLSILIGGAMRAAGLSPYVF